VDILGDEQPSFSTREPNRIIEGRLGHVDVATAQTSFKWKRVGRNDNIFKLKLGDKPKKRGTKTSRSYVGEILETIPGFTNDFMDKKGLITAVEFGGTWVVKPKGDRDFLMTDIRPVNLEKSVIKTVPPVRPYLRTTQDEKVIGQFEKEVKSNVSRKLKGRGIK